MWNCPVVQLPTEARKRHDFAQNCSRGTYEPPDVGAGEKNLRTSVRAIVTISC